MAASAMRSDCTELLLDEGLLSVSVHGSRRSYSAINPKALERFLRLNFDEFRSSALASDGEISDRGSQAADTGNSKLVSVRSCPGFPLNSFEPISCKLGEVDFIVAPQEGSFLFVCDWKSFVVPDDVVLVGIENMENFRLVRRQQEFFTNYVRQLFGEYRKILFVSRYPQSTDLRRWLSGIPNQYLHFGDFDLAGINIFLTEFQQYIGRRASMVIPDDIEGRLATGSASRYDDQYHRFHSLTSQLPDVARLINLIHQYRRCYDQEGYIN